MSSEKSRTILFLQGPPSTFWAELAGEFERRGHKIVKVNVCFGDLYFWRRRGAYHFRRSFKHWPAYLEKIIRRHQVTDILYYADRQPYHVEAQRLGKQFGIPCYAIEYGYLRPEWLTLERGGMGLYSHFPSDPELIRKLAQGLPDPDSKSHYPHKFVEEAYGEVAFHLSSEIFRLFYPMYRSDRYYHAALDYIAYLVQFVRGRNDHRDASRLWRWFEESKTPYFLVALQLQSDYQIRANSHYKHLAQMLDEAIGSFSKNAPADNHLIIKQHPLDNGFENWPKVIRRLAEKHGVADRVHHINGGVLLTLIKAARGALVVNSTVGLHAVRAGIPTKVLGVAVFDVPGMCDQQPLDSFWQTPQPVDMELVDDFVRLMAAAIQVRGSFFNNEGRRAAANDIVRRVEGNLVNQPGAFVKILPRLQQARKLGLPLSAVTLEHYREEHDELPDFAEAKR